MKLSIVIPAYNESVLLGRTLDVVFQVMLDVLAEGRLESYEVIVSDDASTDETADIARQHGAVVVTSGKRNIGATRNVGAQSAQGDWLLFLDADTILNAQTLNEMLDAIDEDIIGGGTVIRWTEKATFGADVCLHLWCVVSRLLSLPAGSYFFVRRDCFERVGGFDETFFVSEELHLGKALKKHGRLTILKTPILTSPRKVHQFSSWEMLSFFAKGIFCPFRTVRDRSKLAIWYERRK